MKNISTIILAVIAILCMVSCEQEPKDRTVVISYDGNTYQLDHVYTSYFVNDGLEVVFSTNSNLRDINTDEGIHFEFEIPLECFGKTLVYSTTEKFDGYGWGFYTCFVDNGTGFGGSVGPGEGSTMTVVCEPINNKVSSFKFIYEGTIDGKMLSVSFEGDADVALDRSWFSK